jgi:hypothetical protein
MSLKRPQTKYGSSTTTPMVASLMKLFGEGLKHEGVTFSLSETRALNKLYGFKPELAQERPPKPVQAPYKGKTSFDRKYEDEAHQRIVENWERWEDPVEMLQAGADRNMIRHAAHDGLRLIAWLAQHVPSGEDPLKTLIQAVIQAGWDVHPGDIAYAEADEDAALEDEEPAEEPPSTPRRKGRGAGKPNGSGA